jgi:hypothetical protein
VVVQPKSYQLEVLIPQEPVGRFVRDRLDNGAAIISGIIDLLSASLTGMSSAKEEWDNEGAIGAIKSLLTVPQAALAVFNTLVGIAARLPGAGGAGSVNKNSLEAMAESGKVLTMKMWTGYQYKYVVITGMSISKRPLEDYAHRGTLQLQEMPILTMTEPKPKKVSAAIMPKQGLAALNDVVNKLRAAVIAPLVQNLGVIEASGQTGESALGAIKSAVGL